MGSLGPQTACSRHRNPATARRSASRAIGLRHGLAESRPRPHGNSSNSNHPRPRHVCCIQASEASDAVPATQQQQPGAAAVSAGDSNSRSSSSRRHHAISHRAGQQEDQRAGSSHTRWWSSVHDRDILALALPAALALAADPLLGMVDTALIGRLGADELAALGVNTSLFTLSFVVFNFLATATTPAVAAAVGARNSQAAGEVVYQATALALLLGAGVAAGLYGNASWMLSVMGAGPSHGEHMHDLAMQYLMIRATAAPAVLLVTVGQGVFRGLQNMRAPLLVTLATNGLHLGLDLLLMFHMGMGIRGAAISTAASEWLAAGAYCWLVWQRRDVLALWPPPRVPLHEARRRMLPFLQAGTAVVMRTGSLLGTKTLATAVAARLGPGAVASHQVLMQVWVLSSMLVDSLAVSGQTLIAVNLGKGEAGTARQISERLLQLGFGVGVGMALLSGASAAWWPQLFTTDDGILGQINQLVPLAVLPLPINSLVYTLDGVLVGASDFGYLMKAMIGASAVAASLLVMVEPSGTGLEGVWAALAVLMVGRLATLGWRFQSADGPLPPTALQLQQHALQEQEQQPQQLQEATVSAGSQHGEAQAGSSSPISSSSSSMAAAEMNAPLLLLNNSVEGSSSLRATRRLAVQQLSSSGARIKKVHNGAAGRSSKCVAGGGTVQGPEDMGL